jgi:hypothetical protein
MMSHARRTTKPVIRELNTEKLQDESVPLSSLMIVAIENNIWRA